MTGLPFILLYVTGILLILYMGYETGFLKKKLSSPPKEPDTKPKEDYTIPTRFQGNPSFTDEQSALVNLYDLSERLNGNYIPLDEKQKKVIGESIQYLKKYGHTRDIIYVKRLVRIHIDNCYMEHDRRFLNEVRELYINKIKTN